MCLCFAGFKKESEDSLKIPYYNKIILNRQISYYLTMKVTMKNQWEHLNTKNEGK